ncbi:MAG: hypothetical protein RMJ97_09655, partial [Raineya sp.]|nr:hypothetical protein [Raineya sp.]
MKVLYTFTFGFILTYTNTLAQCIPSSMNTFGLPSIVCPDENLNFNNPHSAGFTYEWDLCSRDMEAAPQVNFLSGMIGNEGLGHSQLVSENGEYFLFVIAYNTSRLYRIDLGNSPKNEPQAIRNLGNLGVLSNPWTLEILKDEISGIWYGVTCNYISNQFIRLNFGTSIKNTPTASFMGFLPTSYQYTISSKVIKEGSNYYLCVIGETNNAVAIINIGTNFSNFSPANIINNISLTLPSPTDVDMIKDCGVWNLLVTSNTGNKHLIFNSGL